jgi:hypothetical protein
VTVEQLEKALAAMLDPRDIPLSWTQRKLEEHEEQRALLIRRINVAGSAKATLAEIEPQIVELTKQQADLTAIREECCAELLAMQPRSQNRAEMDALQATKISILILDGRFDVHTEPYPAPLPLFMKLHTRGYMGPPHAPWNPMASLFGSLPSIETRLGILRKRRDEAHTLLESVLRDDVVATV